MTQVTQKGGKRPDSQEKKKPSPSKKK